MAIQNSKHTRNTKHMNGLGGREREGEGRGQGRERGRESEGERSRGPEATEKTTTNGGRKEEERGRAMARAMATLHYIEAGVGEQTECGGAVVVLEHRLVVVQQRQLRHGVHVETENGSTSHQQR